MKDPRKMYVEALEGVIDEFNIIRNAYQKGIVDLKNGRMEKACSRMGFLQGYYFACRWEATEWYASVCQSVLFHKIDEKRAEQKDTCTYFNYSPGEGEHTVLLKGTPEGKRLKRFVPSMNAWTYVGVEDLPEHSYLTTITLEEMEEIKKSLLSRVDQ